MEDKLFKARLIDLANRAYRQNTYTYTGFLNAAELSLLDLVAADISFIRHEANGGFALAERQMIRFGSEDAFGYTEPWPVSIVKVTPVIEKFADDLSHRDFLGAIMNLGIDRSTVGDVVIKEKRHAFIVCQSTMSEYICDNLTKVRHTNVKCHAVNEGEELNELKPSLVDVSVIVSAPRFDAVIAAAIKCSRSEALNLFKAGKVTLNGRLCERNSMSLKPMDVFSVRGYGKFQYISTGSETRKGRLYIHLKQYV